MKKLNLFPNSRGLSAVVTTLIIVLLVLVAIGIVWIVIRGVVESGSQQINYSAKCLSVSVQTTAVNCAAGGTSCDAIVRRNAGGNPIAGIKFIFSNITSGSTGTPQTSQGNIAPLATSTTAQLTHGVTPSPNKVDLAVYFKDEAGTEQICPVSHTFNF